MTTLYHHLNKLMELCRRIQKLSFFGIAQQFYGIIMNSNVFGLHVRLLNFLTYSIMSPSKVTIEDWEILCGNESTCSSTLCE